MAKKTKIASAPSQFVSAIFNSKTPEGLTLEESVWDNEYLGTETAFIEAGFIKPEWLPGKPGNAKRKVKVGIKNGEMEIIPPRSDPTDYQWRNGYISITKKSKGRLIVSVNCLPEEQEKREHANFEKNKQVFIKKAHAEIDRHLSCFPINSQDFIEKTQHTVRCFTSVILNNVIHGSQYDGGYHFSSDVTAAFEAWAADAIQLIQEAYIHFDPKIRQKGIADIRDEVWAKYPCLAEVVSEP